MKNSEKNISQSSITSIEIIKNLESAGFRAAFLPYHAIVQIKKSYDDLSEKSKDIQYVQNAVKHFQKIINRQICVLILNGGIKNVLP